MNLMNTSVCFFLKVEVIDVISLKAQGFVLKTQNGINLLSFLNCNGSQVVFMCRTNSESKPDEINRSQVNEDYA